MNQTHANLQDHPVESTGAVSPNAMTRVDRTKIGRLSNHQAAHPCARLARILGVIIPSLVSLIDSIACNPTGKRGSARQPFIDVCGVASQLHLLLASGLAQAKAHHPGKESGAMFLSPPDRREAAQSLLARLVLKQQAVAKVIQGRHTLLEAADCFRAVNGDEQPRNAETLCRAVIGWVDLSLRDRPERAAIVAERLERELQIHLSRSQRLSAPA